MREFIHDRKNQQFVLKLDGELTAKVDYILDGNTMRLIYSEVPSQLRGKGVGKELVERTFEKLTEEGFSAIAICSYIKAIARRSDKWKAIIN